ncbi:DUF3127-containing protein [Aureococcus anophagefferens]|nr:DUF3127-containing protein [Aureococcus anophagefferens]
MSSSGSYDMEGTISKIGEVQTFERLRQDRDLFKDKIGLLDSYAVDDRVCVSFNIRATSGRAAT